MRAGSRRSERSGCTIVRVLGCHPECGSIEAADADDLDVRGSRHAAINHVSAVDRRGASG
jgi:hypothetical protein